MECDVVRDLIPLYLDGCASPGSVSTVEAHIARCPGCRSYLEQSGIPLPELEVSPPKAGRVSVWRASMLQSALFFACFGILTVGVAKEAATPAGLDNGFWGCTVVVPAAGFLLGLANWYFVRVYSSRRSFVIGSVICTAVCTMGCFLWALRHYGFGLSQLPPQGLVFAGAGAVLSWILAGRYAALIGKE